MAKRAPGRLRVLFAALAGAGTAGIGALILGEYPFTGATPYVAGLLFGLVVAEVILTVARSGSRVLAGAAGIESGLGLLWAAWISTAEGVSPMPGAAWVAVALGTLVGAVWVAIPARPSRGARSGNAERPWRPDQR